MARLSKYANEFEGVDEGSVRLSKYANEFEGVDESSVKTAINNFIGSLNEVDYAPCNPLSTNAAYDSTFNKGFSDLKNVDIQSMIELCNSCITQIIEKITTYKSKYSEYESAYATYSTAYDAYEQALSNYENDKKNHDKPTPPSTETVTTLETELTKLAKEIKNATF